MASHSSILAWRVPLTEEPGGLQSMGSQRVGHAQVHINNIWTEVVCGLFVMLSNIICKRTSAIICLRSCLTPKYIIYFFCSNKKCIIHH